MADVTLQSRMTTQAPTGGSVSALLRAFALSMTVTALAFILNNYLIFWLGWPGLHNLADGKGNALLGWLQLAIYLVPVAGVAVYAFTSRQRTMRDDSTTLGALAAFVIRWAFWIVLLVGLADAAISFLRIEGFLEQWLGTELTRDLGVSRLRGAWIHYPLAALAGIIALFTRSLSFVWLALFVVVAEFQIVVARFIFSYEQAFMGDLVRFWYAALFLFASAYTLVEEGHVRVDVLYSGFSDRAKAWCNTIGSAFLGLPLCWVILSLGLWSKASIINSPILAYETSQSGFGMYVKYLMAAFLGVFAVTMTIQFAAFFLEGIADWRGDPGKRAPAQPSAH